jgi:hypothetical protein
MAVVLDVGVLLLRVADEKIAERDHDFLLVH